MAGNGRIGGDGADQYGVNALEQVGIARVAGARGREDLDFAAGGDLADGKRPIFALADNQQAKRGNPARRNCCR